MLFKRFFILIVSLLFYWLSWSGVTLAVPTNLSNPVEIAPLVSEFLSSLPENSYYAIKQVNQVKSIFKDKQALLVDVRQPGEYRSGHIPNAINLPLSTLTENLDQIPHNRPVIFYCSTGYRTAIAVMSLRLLGYDNVTGFAPSIEGWKSAGEPLEK